MPRFGYARRRPWLRPDPEQLHRRSAEHRRLVGVTHPRGVEDEIHGGLRPRIRIVRAHQELTRAHLGGEVTHPFGREHHRVVVHLLEVLGRLLLDRPVGSPGAPVEPGEAPVIGAARVRRQETAAVRRADLETRELVERALEDQVRERDGGLERIADHVVEVAVALEPVLEVGRGASGLRVDEDHHAELLGLGPERVELRIADLHAVDAAADPGAAQPVLLHALLELLGGEVGVLQRHRREGDEALGIGGARLRELLVLELDDLPGEIAVRRVPVRVDAERLDVDALLVHGPKSRRHLGGHMQVRSERRPTQFQIHQRQRLGHRAVRVDIHGPHAPAAHHHVPAARLRPRGRGGHQLASNKRETGERAAGGLEEFPARGRHGWSSRSLRCAHYRAERLATLVAQDWRALRTGGRAASTSRRHRPIRAMFPSAFSGLAPRFTWAMNSSPVVVISNAALISSWSAWTRRLSGWPYVATMFPPVYPLTFWRTSKPWRVKIAATVAVSSVAHVAS